MLVLVLTMADLLTILVGLVGGLTLEVVKILVFIFNKSLLRNSKQICDSKFEVYDATIPRLGTWPGQATLWGASSTTSSPHGRFI